MNTVLKEIVDSAQVVLPTGERVPVSSRIDPDCGALLQRVIRDVRPRVAVRDGLLPLYRADETPNRKIRQKIAALHDVYFPALRKTEDDRRSFDHFVLF